MDLFRQLDHVSTKTLYPYQAKAIENTIKAFESGQNRQLMILATALGKTLTSAALAKHFVDKGKKVLFIAHREELLDQAEAEFLDYIPYITTSIEQGESWANENAEVIFASVASIGRSNSNRIKRFDRNQFGLIIIDEAHRATASTYTNVIDYFLHDKCLLFGVTATPNRTDEESLTSVFNHVCYKMDIVDGTKQKYLTPLVSHRVSSKTDLAKVRTTAGDFNLADLSLAVNTKERNSLIVETYLKRFPDKQALVFATDLDHVRDLTNEFTKSGVKTFSVSGETPKDQRRQIISDFKNKKTDVVINYGILCLDSKTEILTRQGWKTYENITDSDLVANYVNDGEKSGTIFFEEPKFIIKRNRYENELMVSVESHRHSIRVTQDHRMLWRKHYEKHKPFRISHAIDLVSQKIEIPTSGIAEPEKTHFEQTILSENELKRKIITNKCQIKKFTGMSPEEAEIEAIKRINERLKRNVFKNSHELTNEECEFIGIFLADGCITHLKSKGVEFVITMPTKYTNIIKWIDQTIKTIGVYVNRKEQNNVQTSFGTKTSRIKWSFARGTSYNGKSGLRYLEPYLDKNNPDFLWSLNREQISHFIKGYWIGNGDHRGQTTDPKGKRLYTSRKHLADLMQAVFTCRGYTVTNRENPNGKFPIYCLTLSQRSSVQLATKTLTKESTYSDEIVWCVTSTTGNIITRRNGFVAVTGNTEGFNYPELELIIQARPTQSQLLMVQIAGRATRKAAGKKVAHIVEIIDYHSSKTATTAKIFGFRQNFDCEDHDFLECVLKAEELEKDKEFFNPYNCESWSDMLLRHERATRQNPAGNVLVQGVVGERGLRVRKDELYSEFTPSDLYFESRYRYMKTKAETLKLVHTDKERGKKYRIQIFPNGLGSFDVTLHSKAITAGFYDPPELEIQYRCVSQASAARKIEEYILTHYDDWDRLLNINAAWRKRAVMEPVTDKQWNLIERYRLTGKSRSEVSKAEAMELLSIHFAK